MTLSSTGSLTLEDLVYLAYLRRRLQVRPGFRLGIAILSVCGLMTFTLLVNGFNWGSLVLPLGGLYGIYWLFVAPRVEAKRSHEMLTHRGGNTSVELSSERIMLSTDESGGWISWKDLDRILDTPLGLVFVLPEERIWFFLPEQVFIESFSREAVISLVKENNVQIEKRV